MNEASLIEKLRLIEALFSGAATEGEALAAERAKERILNRLKSLEEEDPAIEYRFTMGDMWSRKVFTALLRRYGIRPYRYSGQRHTTVMAKVPESFVNDTLWPELQEIYKTLRVYLSEVTERVVSQVIHQDSADAEVVESPKGLAAVIPAADAEYGASSVPTSESGQNRPSGSEGAGQRNHLKRRGKKGKKRKR